MKIPWLSKYLAAKRINRRLETLCKQSLYAQARKRSQAAVKGNATRNHHNSKADPVVMEREL